MRQLAFSVHPTFIATIPQPPPKTFTPQMSNRPTYPDALYDPDMERLMRAWQISDSPSPETTNTITSPQEPGNTPTVLPTIPSTQEPRVPSQVTEGARDSTVTIERWRRGVVTVVPVSSINTPRRDLSHQRTMRTEGIRKDSPELSSS